MLTITLLASAGGIGWWLFQRRQPAAHASTAARNPVRCADPQRQAARVSPVWQLHSNGCQCEQARRYAGKRLALEDARPLIEAGQNCRCYWRPLPDQRRSPRRKDEDRRAALRFDLKKVERRGGDRRKQGAVWERTLGY